MQFTPLSTNHVSLFHKTPLPLARSSDFNFFNQYLWRDVVQTNIAVEKDSFLVRKEENDRFRFYCSDNPMMWIKRVKSLSLSKKKFFYCCKDQLSSPLEESYSFVEDEDQCEYMYKYQTIRGFTGKKLQKKRNHLNFFLNNFSFRVEQHLNVAEYDTEILPFFTNEEERRAYSEFTKYPLEPHLLPLGIFVDNELVAFTLGNIIHDTCIIHFEKARKDIRGSYQAIFYHLLESLADKGIEWINREQDLGLEYLRISKKSYYPDDCIKKYKTAL